LFLLLFLLHFLLLLLRFLLPLPLPHLAVSFFWEQRIIAVKHRNITSDADP
jgi:hypothetical protein